MLLKSVYSWYVCMLSSFFLDEPAFLEADKIAVTYDDVVENAYSHQAAGFSEGAGDFDILRGGLRVP